MTECRHNNLQTNKTVYQNTSKVLLFDEMLMNNNGGYERMTKICLNILILMLIL